MTTTLAPSETYTDTSYSRKEISLQRNDMIDAVRWSWFDDIGWYPHAYQVLAHNSPARFRVTCAGTRGGKTEWAGREASAYMVAGPFRIWIVAGSYDLGYKEFRVVKDSLLHKANPHRIVTLHDNLASGNLKITLSNGSECEVRSIDKPKKSGWGEEIDLMLISEAALIDNLGGEDGVWNKMLRGRLASRLGDVIVPTTPSGKDNFLYPMFMKGLRDPQLRHYYGITDEPDPEYFSLQWPSWANPEGFMEDPVKLYQELPYRIFLEQYWGAFVKWSGSIWLNDFCYDPNIHLVEPSQIPEWWRRFEVIDPGFSGLFAWISCVADEKGNVYIVDEYGDRQKTYDIHVAAIKQKRMDFSVFSNYRYDDRAFIPIFIDPEDPQCREELAQRGLHVTQANNDVVAGFQSAGMLFKAGRLHIFNWCKRLDDSLRNHEWAKSRQEGQKRKEANDAWKHFSDLMRYMALSPMYPSEKPKPKQEGITVADIINGGRAGNSNPYDMSFDELARLHERVRAA